MPKHIVTPAMEGTWKRGRPREWWRGQVQEDLRYNGNNKQAGISQGPLGNQGPQRTAAVEEEEEENINMFVAPVL